MEIIKLPALFTPHNDLTAINKKLRNHTAKLDWSSVISISESDLAILLDCIAEDDEVLNLDGGIADHILDKIAGYFSTRSQTKVEKTNETKTQLTDSNDEGKSTLTNADNDLIPDSKNKKKIDHKPQNREKKTILKSASHHQIRKELVEAIYKDLLGPVGGEDEEIDEMNVSDRYLVGLLAPQIRNKKAQSNTEEIPTEDSPEQQDELGVAMAGNAEEGSNENSVPPTNTMFPSSMGMSFCVAEDAKSLKITAEWGQYERQKGEFSFKEDGTAKTIWKRYPRKGSKVFPLENGQEIHWVVSPDEAPSVYVTGKMRLTSEQGWIVTLFLVNGQTEPSKLRDRSWLFQPKLTVTSGDVTLTAPKNPDKSRHVERAVLSTIHAEESRLGKEVL